jgi:predicted transcriptional regulator
LLQDQEAWRADASRKIDEGWEQAKAGQLSTPDEVRQSLAACKEVWKQAHAS